MHDQYYVYILTNYSNNAIYVGVTNDLKRRVHEHRDNFVKGFCAKYGINKLVFYEISDNIEAAIAREKQLKAGSRKKKLDLVNKFNPEWKELYDSI
jgi:putative endonuclease